MKNITLSADQSVVRRAREKARAEHTTLNALFRRWLIRYVEQSEAEQNYRELMGRLSYVLPGRRFSRDEMNER